MQTNKPRSPGPRTHEGAPAYPHLSPWLTLRRSVLACMLWEDQFYEDGEDIAKRIRDTAASVPVEKIAQLAIEARHKHNLRHVPLLLLRELVWRAHGQLASKTIEQVVSRADELPELLSIYWQEGKKPLAKQLKLGLARAFRKFDAYQLAKYNRDKAITLRDVMFLVHPEPKDATQAAVWKHLADNTLKAPDTWEVALSGGADKKTTFERLLRENNLGYLALLRNLRNMQQAGVDESLVKASIHARKGAQRVLPFRYYAAAKAAPRYERQLDEAMVAAISDLPKLPGTTAILVDVSGSMNAPLSSRSDLTRMDAAAVLASMVQADDKLVFTFSYRTVEVPARDGMAGVEAIVKSQEHGGTCLARAVLHINQHVPCDRLIVITDEQATMEAVPNAKAPLAYMINVGSYRNGVGYGKWTHIDGFSENVLTYLHELEASFGVNLREPVAE